MSVAAHQLKNIMLSNNLGQAGSANEAVVYVTLLDSGADAKDRDFKVEKLS